MKLPAGYAVSPDGVVTSYKRGMPRPLAVTPDSNGYPSVKLNVNGKQKRVAVYRLVAAKYLPPKPDLPNMVLCHKDGDDQNHHADNLAWGTQWSNMQDKIKHRLTRNEHVNTLEEREILF